MEASRGGVRRRHPPGVARAVRGARAAGAARVVDDGGRGHEGTKNENHTTFLPCSRTCLVLTHYKMTGFDLTFSHLRHFTVLAVSSLSLSIYLSPLLFSTSYSQIHPAPFTFPPRLLSPPATTHQHPHHTAVATAAASSARGYTRGYPTNTTSCGKPTTFPTHRPRPRRPSQRPALPSFAATLGLESTPLGALPPPPCQRVLLPSWVALPPDEPSPNSQPCS